MKKYVLFAFLIAGFVAVVAANVGHSDHAVTTKKVPRHIAENSYNAHMLYSRSASEPPKIEIRAFNGHVWPRSDEVGRFIRTRQGATFKLNASDERYEAFIAYGNIGTPASDTFRQTNSVSANTDFLPYSKYLLAPNGKRYKTALESIEVYVYNPKFPEYHRFPLSQVEENLSQGEELTEK